MLRRYSAVYWPRNPLRSGPIDALDMPLELRRIEPDGFHPVTDEQGRLIGIMRRIGSRRCRAEGLDRLRADPALPIPGDEHDEAVAVPDRMI